MATLSQRFTELEHEVREMRSASRSTIVRPAQIHTEVKERTARIIAEGSNVVAGAALDTAEVAVFKIRFTDVTFAESAGIKTLTSTDRGVTDAYFAGMLGGGGVAVDDNVTVTRINDRWWINGSGPAHHLAVVVDVDNDNDPGVCGSGSLSTSKSNSIENCCNINVIKVNRVDPHIQLQVGHRALTYVLSSTTDQFALAHRDMCPKINDVVSTYRMGGYSWVEKVWCGATTIGVGFLEEQLPAATGGGSIPQTAWVSVWRKISSLWQDSGELVQVTNRDTSFSAPGDTFVVFQKVGCELVVNWAACEIEGIPGGGSGGAGGGGGGGANHIIRICGSTFPFELDILSVESGADRSGDFDYNATAAEIVTHIEAWPLIGTGNVQANSGGPLPSAVVLEWIGDMAGVNVTVANTTAGIGIGIDDTYVTAGTYKITTDTQGGGGVNEISRVEIRTGTPGGGTAFLQQRHGSFSALAVSQFEIAFGRHPSTDGNTSVSAGPGGCIDVEFVNRLGGKAHKGFSVTGAGNSVTVIQQGG